MNIAFSTIIILFLLLPGQIFRRFYYSEEFSKQYFKQSVNELFVAVFIPSLVFHSIWILTVPLFNYYVDLRILGEILLSKDYPVIAFESIQSMIKPILVYHLTIFLFAGFIGFFLKMLIRKARLDLKIKMLRFQNSWHYILTGEFFEFPRASTWLEDDTIDDIELRYVDALVEVNGTAVIYDGILVDYELSKEGGLDYLTLYNVQRRYLKDDPRNKEILPEVDSEVEQKNEPELESEVEEENDSDEDVKLENINNPEPYNIPGHILLLPYSKILNLNFTYYKVIELSNGEFDVQEVE